MQRFLGEYTWLAYISFMHGFVMKNEKCFLYIWCIYDKHDMWKYYWHIVSWLLRYDNMCRGVIIPRAVLWFLLRSTTTRLETATKELHQIQLDGAAQEKFNVILLWCIGHERIFFSILILLRCQKFSQDLTAHRPFWMLSSVAPFTNMV